MWKLTHRKTTFFLKKKCTNNAVIYISTVADSVSYSIFLVKQRIIRKKHVLGICNMAKHKFCSKFLCIIVYVSHIIMAPKSAYASNNSFRMSVQGITCKWIKNTWAKFILKYRTWPNMFWVFTHHRFLTDTVGWSAVSAVVLHKLFLRYLGVGTWASVCG